VIGVYFDVLEGDLLLEQDEKNTLNEGAELDCSVTLLSNPETMGIYPSRIKLKRLLLLVRFHHMFCCSRSMREDLGIRVIDAHLELIAQNQLI
jgi:hypothetical protein